MTSKKRYLADFLDRDPKAKPIQYAPEPVPYPICNDDFNYAFAPFGSFYLRERNCIVDVIKNANAKWFAKNCRLANYYSNKKAPKEFVKYLYENLFYNKLNCLGLYEFVLEKFPVLAHFCLDCPYYYKFADSLT